MTVPGNLSSPLLATAAAGAAGGVATRSLRFNSADSAYLSRTPSSNGNRRTFTFSCWVKRSKPVPSSSGQELFRAGDSALSAMNFAPSDGPVDSLSFKADQGGVSPGSATNAVFRDFSAWMHVVYRIDTTQATAADRVRIYVNGVEQTFHTANYPSQNQELKINQSGQPHYIGGKEYFDGYLADIYLIDGSSLDPTSFGAYDNNGVWQAAAYSGTFGTNGFHLLDFANESTIGHDSSGNDNDFTANNFTASATRTINTFGSISTTVSTEPFSGAGGAIGGGTTSDYVQVPAHADFSLDGVFTVEWFHYRASQYASANMWTLGDSKLSSGLELYWGGGGATLRLYTNNGQTDASVTASSGWHHYAVVRDSSNNIKVYYDGTLAITHSSNSNTFSGAITFGEFYNGAVTAGMLGPMSNFRLVKGSAVYTSNFTAPSSALTAITNTKLLTFQGSTIADASGVSFATDLDVLFDVPTNGDASNDSGAGGEISGNYCTINALLKGSNTNIANGNLEINSTSSTWNNCFGTIAIPASGKWYWEVEAGGGNTQPGIVPVSEDLAGNVGTYPSNNLSFRGYYGPGGNKITGPGAGSSSYGASFTTGDIVGIAFDADAGSLTFYKNGVSQGVAFTGLTDQYIPIFGTFDTGVQKINFGQRAFAYSAPSGYKALCTTNLPTPTIADGSDYFDVKLYTGDGASASSTQAITGFSFSPDWLWIKCRSTTPGHAIYDTVRAITQRLSSSQTTIFNNEDIFESFDSTGFTVKGNSNPTNANNETYVAFCWDAGSSTASNTDGSITSSVRVNQTAGFSIVSWTSSSSVSTVGHGLSDAPYFIVTKNTSVSNAWWSYHFSIGNTKAIRLDTTDTPSVMSSAWNNTSPTNSVFTVGGEFGSGNTMIAYCFTPVSGYSQIGEYTANGSSNGPFVQTNFAVAWLMTKRTNTTGPWEIHNYRTPGYNPQDERIIADSNGAEASGNDVDFLSNGFKIRNTFSGMNGSSGDTYIYLAFASNPFSSNGGLAR